MQCMHVYIYRLRVCTEIIDREIEGKIHNHANPDGTEMENGTPSKAPSRIKSKTN